MTSDNGRQHYLRAATLFAVGGSIFAIPWSYGFHGEPLGVLMTTFGSLLIGSALVDALFQLRFQRQIQDQVNTLKTNISTLQDTVMIAKGAVEAGLTAVYATREECLHEIKRQLERTLQSIDNRQGGSSKIIPRLNLKEKEEPVKISLLGVSLGDFLCPHGFLQPTFRRILANPHFSIQVAILEDACEAALYRAVREECSKFYGLTKGDKDLGNLSENKSIVDKYYKTKCHGELKTATDYLEDLVNQLAATPTECPEEKNPEVVEDRADDEDESVKAELAAYVYKVHPMAFIFAMKDTMFIENYHLAGRGGEAPILQVSRFQKGSSRQESKLYEIFSRHFKSIIGMANTLEPSQRTQTGLLPNVDLPRAPTELTRPCGGRS